MMVTFTVLCRISKRKYKDLTLRWCCCAVGSCSPPARPPFPSSTTLTNSRHSIFHFPACVLANLYFILLSVFSPSFIGFSLLSFFFLIIFSIPLQSNSSSSLKERTYQQPRLPDLPLPCPLPSPLLLSQGRSTDAPEPPWQSVALGDHICVCACVWM
jgi:hypothetical protein